MNTDDGLQLLQRTQQLDQQAAGLTDFAATLATYMKALMTNGFTRREAVDIAADYQHEVFSAALNQNRTKDKL